MCRGKDGKAQMGYQARRMQADIILSRVCCSFFDRLRSARLQYAKASSPLIICVSVLHAVCPVARTSSGDNSAPERPWQAPLLDERGSGMPTTPATYDIMFMICLVKIYSCTRKRLLGQMHSRNFPHDMRPRKYFSHPSITFRTCPVTASAACNSVTSPIN